jgi:hypothetical protein
MGKFRFILAIMALSTLTAYAQQNIKCVKGNCLNGYGLATLSNNTNEIGYQVGFHENQLLNGIGNQTGDFGKYWGTFNNGVKHGFFSYESEGNMYAFGMYVDGKREGLHVIRNKSGYEFRDYQNDKHMSNSPLPTTGLSPCVMGNCENGNGVKVDGNDAVFSNWKDGNMHGLTMQFLMSEKKIIFSEFTDGIVDGVQMIWHFDGTKEILQMQNGTINGQYLKKNQNNTHEAAIYKNGQMTTSL